MTTENHDTKCWEEYRSYKKPILPGCLVGKDRCV